MSEILSKIDVNDYNVQAMEGGSAKLQEKTATPSTSQQVVEPDEGYDGMSSVTVGAVTSAIDENIIPTNIRTGKTILGVQGNLEPDKPDQSKTVTPTTSEQVIVGDTGYELASVTVEAIQTETKTVKSTTSSQTVTPSSGKFINEITVSPISLESKDVSISTNGTITITPTSGYDGISDVDVTVSGILDTSDANATASDIISNKTAYVNGQKIIGSIAVKDILQSTADNVSDNPGNSKIIAQSFHTGENTRVAVDTNAYLNIDIPYNKLRNPIGLTANKILAGNSIIGVAGTATSDATAVASDIASGKTAYVDGVKLTGTATEKSVKENAVNFYDYDGTLIKSYSRYEFANLTEMPANPTHTGLTAQGWNWTLSDAKTYVAELGKLNIGQMYITDDGKTRVYISLEEGRLEPYFGIALNGEATIDWGDGSEPSTISGSNINIASSIQHTYSIQGDYIITVESNTNLYIVGSLAYGSSLLTKGSTQSYNDCVYQNAIKKVELNNRTFIGTGAFYRCFSLETVTTHNNMTSIGDNTTFSYSGLKSLIIPSGVTVIYNSTFAECDSLAVVSLPNSITTIQQAAFARCTSLKSITIPKTTTTIGRYAFQDCKCLVYATVLFNDNSGQSIFQNCFSLKEVTIANSSTFIPGYSFNGCKRLDTVIILGNITSIATSAFVSCEALRKINLPNNITSINNSAMNSCKSLSSIRMPRGITSIGDYTFYDCINVKFYDFTDSTEIPSLGGTNAFTNIASDCKIVVPDNLYSSWITTSNWSSLSNYIIRESDWV